MESDKELKIPGSDDVLRPGYQVKLGRFNTTVWTVGFGWYSASGNRPCCGWYLTTDEGKVTKPLHSADLTDIYVVEMCYVNGASPHRAIEAIDAEVSDLRREIDAIQAGFISRNEFDSILLKIEEKLNNIECKEDIDE